jgi:hypothetical protein
MKKSPLIVMLIVFLMLPGLSFARGGCPDTADQLEAYARCMVPLRGEIGTAYRGNAFALDPSNQETLSAIAYSRMSAPHIVAGGRGYGGYYPALSSEAAAMIYWMNFGAYWGSRR